MFKIHFSVYMHNNFNYYIGNHQTNTAYPEESYAVSYDNLAHDLLDHNKRELKQTSIRLIDEIKAIGAAPLSRQDLQIPTMFNEALNLVASYYSKTLCEHIIEYQFMSGIKTRLKNHDMFQNLQEPPNKETILDNFEYYPEISEWLENNDADFFLQQIILLLFDGYTRKEQYFDRHGVISHVAYEELTAALQEDNCALDTHIEAPGQRAHFIYDYNTGTVEVSKKSFVRLPQKH